MPTSKRNYPIGIGLFFLAVCLSLGVVGTGQADAGQDVREAPRAKYVFLFIGDGMGLAQRQAAELYAAGRAGAKQPDLPHLTMSSFPVTGMATTHPANALVTDSAAAGTALACGFKTSNGKLSTSADGAFSFKTVAEAAKERGMKVGIVSSANIDDATPAAFYAHQPLRSNYWEIAMQLAGSGFDYFGGGGMAGDRDFYRQGRESPLEAARRNGFRIATNRDELLALKPDGGRTIAYPQGAKGGTSMRYEIDRPDDQASLADFTRKGIELLDDPRGFFMIVEGAKIDGACHVNDAATAIRDVIALDEAVAAACAFLRQHPEDTTIVVTADHETGGLTIVPGGLDCEGLYRRMKRQRTSQGLFLRGIEGLIQLRADFAEAMVAIEECFGLMANDDPDIAELRLKAEAGDPEAKAALGLVLRPSEFDALKRAWKMSLLDEEARIADPEVRSLYGTYNPISVECTHVHNRKAGMAWMTYGHTGIPVPVSAVGAGQEIFGGYYDNTDVARKLMSLIGAEPQAVASRVMEPVGAAAP